MIWKKKPNIYSVMMFLMLTNLLSILKIITVETNQFWTIDKQFYILIYTNPDRNPFSYLWETEDQYVKKKKCHYQNCHFIKNHSYVEDIKRYDAILFHVADLPRIRLPEERSDVQRYIFVSDEPPTLYGITSDYNDVFNFTWTYKLNSDITLRNFIAKTKKNNEIIGPAKELDGIDGSYFEVHWVDVVSDKEPISDAIKIKLQNKTKAAAWFASDCHTSSGREDYVKNLIHSLKNHNLTLDIYGKCGNLTCPHDSFIKCKALLQSEYFFYLAFESSMSEDYVTDELLIPLRNFAVPVVYGGANYDRFMPKGMYLDANSVGPKELARSMSYYITNKDKYYDLFKWHNIYSYHYSNESAETDEICAFCAFLNDEKYLYKTSVYTYIEKFWI